LAEILTFVLVAPLGAMGGVAVGENRTGWDRPGRSAVLGLVAACLGFLRSEEAAQAELAAGLGLGLRREGQAGPLLTDYHTAQTQASRKGRRFATRREELQAPNPETVLSRRDYRSDCAFTGALWRRPAATMRWSLDDLVAAMRTPRFVPYLGRKSCPLGLPLAPRIVSADTLAAAFARRDAEVATEAGRRQVAELELLALSGQGRPAEGMVWADPAGADEPPLGLKVSHTETRRDAPLSRWRWQFALREEQAARWLAPEA